MNEVNFVSQKIMYCFTKAQILFCKGAVVVVIVWLLDLQLPVQSVTITTEVVSSNPAHDKVYTRYNIMW